MGHLTKQDFWDLAETVHRWHIESAGDIGIDPGRYAALVDAMGDFAARRHRQDSTYQFNRSLFVNACYGRTPRQQRDVA